MAITVYMQIIGRNQGEIKGDSDKHDERRDKIVVYSVNHGIEIPYDKETGNPNGKRIHNAFTVMKSLDITSQMLNVMCCKGELCDVELTFYKDNEEGKEELYYTVMLSDALIVNIEMLTPFMKVDGKSACEVMEKMSFSYSKISWRYKNNAISQDELTSE